MDSAAPIVSPPRRWLPFLWIALAAAAAHLWCLGSVFYLDDGVAILRNELVRSGHFLQGGLSAWTTFGYVIQERLFGFSSIGFHGVNWLLHTVVALVLYGFGSDFLEDEKNGGVALFGALLFAVHPLGSEIPNYARTQDLAWVTLFSLSAAWAMLRFLQKRTGVAALGVWTLCVAGAAFSKGPGVLHALMMSGAVAAVSLPEGGVKFVRRHRWLMLAAVALPLVLWWSVGSTIYQLGVRGWSDPRFVGHAYTVSRVFWEFAWRAVVPISLSADHHIAETLVRPGDGWLGVQDGGAVFAAGMMLAVAAGSVVLAMRRGSRAFGICLFLFVGSILFRVLYLIPEFMPEYRIYPGLPWFCLGASIFLGWAVRKWTEIPAKIPALVLLGVFAFLSAKRSFLWHDLDKLLADVLRQYPTQARAVWELHDRDLALGHWEQMIERQRTVWPEVARRFHETNRVLAPARELPTGHFALAEVACMGNYAVAMAATEGRTAGEREIHRLETYMRQLGLDPVAHGIHWDYFRYSKALMLEAAGDPEAAAVILRAPGVPAKAAYDLTRIEKRLASKRPTP